MSYSRWSNSYWYTFWHVPDDKTKENRDNAKFTICTFGSYSAAQLRNKLDRCLHFVKCKEPDGNIEELKGYVAQFLADVDKEYPDPIEHRMEMCGCGHYPTTMPQPYPKGGKGWIKACLGCGAWSSVGNTDEQLVINIWNNTMRRRRVNA